MKRYIELEISIKDRLIFLLFSMLREDLLSSKIIGKETKLDRTIIQKPIVQEKLKTVKNEIIPFFDLDETPVKSKIK